MRRLTMGQIRIWPLVETAQAIQRSDRMAAASPRIAYMCAGTSRQGDIARALRFKWTPENTATLYGRSKVLVDVRGAGVANPMSGLISISGSSQEKGMLARQAGERAAG